MIPLALNCLPSFALQEVCNEINLRLKLLLESLYPDLLCGFVILLYYEENVWFGCHSCEVCTTLYITVMGCSTVVIFFS